MPENPTALRGLLRGAAWLSSARAVRCRLKCHNERNPYRQLLTSRVEDSVETAGASCEEGGDDVKSARPLRPGRHTCYNGRYREKPFWRQSAETRKPCLSSDWSLQPIHESWIRSNRAYSHCAVNTFPGLVHTAVNHGSRDA